MSDSPAWASNGDIRLLEAECVDLACETVTRVNGFPAKRVFLEHNLKDVRIDEPSELIRYNGLVKLHLGDLLNRKMSDESIKKLQRAITAILVGEIFLPDRTILMDESFNFDFESESKIQEIASVIYNIVWRKMISIP